MKHSNSWLGRQKDDFLDRRTDRWLAKHTPSKMNNQDWDKFQDQLSLDEPIEPRMTKGQSECLLNLGVAFSPLWTKEKAAATILEEQEKRKLNNILSKQDKTAGLIRRRKINSKKIHGERRRLK